jgi:hypothetical protein
LVCCGIVLLLPSGSVSGVSGNALIRFLPSGAL